MNTSIKRLSIAFFSLLAMISSSVVMAGQWADNHPRRHEVNARLNNQDRRIHQEVKTGEISHAEARQLHQQDRSIRHQERRMARRDDGHLTAGDQARLNRRENKVSHEIGK